MLVSTLNPVTSLHFIRNMNVIKVAMHGSGADTVNEPLKGAIACLTIDTTARLGYFSDGRKLSFLGRNLGAPAFALLVHVRVTGYTDSNYANKYRTRGAGLPGRNI